MSRKKRIAILGANSSIAKSFLYSCAIEGNEFVLVARSVQDLKLIQDVLIQRGALKVEIIEYDFLHLEEHQNLINKIWISPVNQLLIAYGTLPDQARAKEDQLYFLQQFELNAVSILVFLQILQSKFESQCYGTLAVITSVAADRGKGSNYLYGSAKAAVSVYLEGMRCALDSHGIHVLEIKPGFVDTPMTESFRKNFLWATPEYVGKKIVLALQRKKNIVYIPWFWRWIMFVIKWIPTPIFKKMKM
ncbi:MAG: SDR family NAD(P)-dependent oxidoreductase [Bdellovibrionales bacterium]|nr:SDR family NAD(P)-dependent oxidoreductase [Bdellovibrionales bacterium]